jgi:hypothetical protein
MKSKSNYSKVIEIILINKVLFFKKLGTKEAFKPGIALVTK